MDSQKQIAELQAELTTAHKTLYDLTMLVIRQAQELVGKDEVKAANQFLNDVAGYLDNPPQSSPAPEVRFCDQFGDRGLWNEHPDYPRSDWQYEVANGDTISGYWDYVESCIEMAAREVEDEDEGPTCR